ncbi:LLM class flavin-dependent oxidoreductase [Pseudomonas aeruginosa]|uniref:LLM class flavin-dependent oxidoreductase n=1 Tax=Pseudomonas aeruginosa TaxID=287 RepID=UPI002A6A250A|nr:LLM class flavin-dependent oxidoreductase [Pseudomonas aeruginosa]MDY1053350.1 LLM class flavin-dependent oxidoreductase [Pseudomonas aeruginosa]HEP9718758.1 LLM class flavin-dependent oxidoreductase [Pseudomonas aeruginosa]HEP9725333.1 LLM class flavin-dependent oxidoreductase [Pseudomonas aeruginosa]
MSTPPFTSARTFKLGFLSHAFGSDPRQVYRDLQEQFEVAEALGFDGGWIAQHHLSGGFGQLPSPLLLFAAIAARTRRIELGTAVITLPLEDALRLAEDAAVLDALSGGRLQLGLGSGGANLEIFNAFGREAGNRQVDFQRAQRTLQDALLGAPLPGTARLRLHPPAAGLRERLWHSHGSTAGAIHAAGQGNGLLLGTATHDPLTVQKPLAEAYLGAWQDATRRPRIGVVRAVFPAEDKVRARAELAADIELHVPRLIREGLIDQAADLESHLRLLNVHHGDPVEVVASLRGDPSLLPYADYFIAVVQSESSTQTQVLRRLESLARDVAPALGWAPAGERLAVTG